LVRRWLAEGAAAFPEDIARPLEKSKDQAFKDVVGIDYIHKKILEHIRGLRLEDRRYVRYFSINHLLTGGVTREELDLHRDALTKAFNHLTWEPLLVRPQAIDEPINSLFAVDIRQLGWHRQPFQRIKGRRVIGRSELNLFDLVLLEYPYAVLYEDSETFDHLVDEFLRPAGQVRPIIYVRADWFVSTATQPPLYEDLLQLPYELKQLADRLGIDADANLNSYIARRAGMTVSGVSRNNRVVERHPTKYGAYWKSYDFRSSKGDENIFQDPVHLYPAGSEMIFNLPNGLQGYLLANGKGARLESAPTEIVTDKFAEDKTVRNGLACMRCHDQGMKTFLDTVHPAMLRLPGSAGLDKRQVLQLYPEQKELDRLVAEDTERFLSSLERVLGKPQRQEPLIPVSRRFLDSPLQLSAAAAELGLAEPSGLKEVFRAPQFAALGLVPLSVGGVVRRDMWEDYYDQVVRGLGLGIPIVPLDGLTRRDFRGDPALDVELRTNKKGNVFEAGDELVIYVLNRSKKDVYIELIGTSARGEKVILPVAANRVRAGQEYRFPPSGGLKIRSGVGREEITLFASEVEMPAGWLLRGKGVSDRVIHPWYEPSSARPGKNKYFDPTRLIKKTIDLETR
jgi:serine/threonine-protein kinase